MNGNISVINMIFLVLNDSPNLLKKFIDCFAGHPIYVTNGNVRFPFIASLLPGGNGREIDRIGSRAENHYEKLFWRIAEFERPPP